MQKAIDAVIQPALALLDPTVPVFDHVPQGTAFPYVQFGRVIRTADNNFASKLSRVQVTLSVFSDFRGQEQVLSILGAIEAVLDEATLTLDSGVAVRCDLERADTVRDQDGVTYSGSAIYLVIADH